MAYAEHLKINMYYLSSYQEESIINLVVYLQSVKGRADWEKLRSSTKKVSTLEAEV